MLDGTQQAITITINGTDDVPSIGGEVLGTVTEDEFLSASGQLNIVISTLASHSRRRYTG